MKTFLKWTAAVVCVLLLACFALLLLLLSGVCSLNVPTFLKVVTKTCKSQPWLGLEAISFVRHHD